MKRTKPICSNCGLDMYVSTMGVECVEMFQSPPQPYRIISGDEWACRNCKIKIISGFAVDPIEHYHPDFILTLKRYLQTDKIRSKIRVVWENLSGHQKPYQRPLAYLDYWLHEQKDGVVDD